jgi:hypothetical protein
VPGAEAGGNARAEVQVVVVGVNEGMGAVVGRIGLGKAVHDAMMHGRWCSGAGRGEKEARGGL